MTTTTTGPLASEHESSSYSRLSALLRLPGSRPRPRLFSSPSTSQPQPRPAPDVAKADSPRTPVTAAGSTQASPEAPVQPSPSLNRDIWPDLPNTYVFASPPGHHHDVPAATHQPGNRAGGGRAGGRRPFGLGVTYGELASGGGGAGTDWTTSLGIGLDPSSHGSPYRPLTGSPFPGAGARETSRTGLSPAPPRTHRVQLAAGASNTTTSSPLDSVPSSTSTPEISSDSPRLPLTTNLTSQQRRYQGHRLSRTQASSYAGLARQEIERDRALHRASRPTTAPTGLTTGRAPSEQRLPSRPPRRTAGIPKRGHASLRYRLASSASPQPSQKSTSTGTTRRSSDLTHSSASTNRIIRPVDERGFEVGPAPPFGRAREQRFKLGTVPVRAKVKAKGKGAVGRGVVGGGKDVDFGGQKVRAKRPVHLLQEGGAGPSRDLLQRRYSSALLSVSETASHSHPLAAPGDVGGPSSPVLLGSPSTLEHPESLRRSIGTLSPTSFRSQHRRRHSSPSLSRSPDPSWTSSSFHHGTYTPSGSRSGSGHGLRRSMSTSAGGEGWREGSLVSGSNGYMAGTESSEAHSHRFATPVHQHHHRGRNEDEDEEVEQIVEIKRYPSAVGGGALSPAVGKRRHAQRTPAKRGKRPPAVQVTPPYRSLEYQVTESLLLAGSRRASPHPPTTPSTSHRTPSSSSSHHASSAADVSRSFSGRSSLVSSRTPSHRSRAYLSAHSHSTRSLASWWSGVESLRSALTRAGPSGRRGKATGLLLRVHNGTSEGTSEGGSAEGSVTARIPQPPPSPGETSGLLARRPIERDQDEEDEDRFDVSAATNELGLLVAVPPLSDTSPSLAPTTLRSPSQHRIEIPHELWASSGPESEGRPSSALTPTTPALVPAKESDSSSESETSEDEAFSWHDALAGSEELAVVVEEVEDAEEVGLGPVGVRRTESKVGPIRTRSQKGKGVMPRSSVDMVHVRRSSVSAFVFDTAAAGPTGRAGHARSASVETGMSWLRRTLNASPSLAPTTTTIALQPGLQARKQERRHSLAAHEPTSQPLPSTSHTQEGAPRSLNSSFAGRSSSSSQYDVSIPLPLPSPTSPTGRSLHHRQSRAIFAPSDDANWLRRPPKQLKREWKRHQRKVEQRQRRASLAAPSSSRTARHGPATRGHGYSLSLPSTFATSAPESSAPSTRQRPAQPGEERVAGREGQETYLDEDLLGPRIVRPRPSQLWQSLWSESSSSSSSRSLTGSGSSNGLASRFTACLPEALQLVPPNAWLFVGGFALFPLWYIGCFYPSLDGSTFGRRRRPPVPAHVEHPDDHDMEEIESPLDRVRFSSSGGPLSGWPARSGSLASSSSSTNIPNFEAGSQEMRTLGGFWSEVAPRDDVERHLRLDAPFWAYQRAVHTWQLRCRVMSVVWTLIALPVIVVVAILSK